MLVERDGRRNHNSHVKCIGKVEGDRNYYLHVRCMKLYGAFVSIQARDTSLQGGNKGEAS